MIKEHDIINNILIELTDAIGFDGSKKGQTDAFLKARDALEKLIAEIDSAERV